MGGKLIEKKKQKLASLYNAAYDLLTSNGIHNTVIDDVVKHAGVAKGTFYLYFKDKDDLVNKVIIRKTSALINEAIEALQKKSETESRDFRQSVIFISDYMIGCFMNDKKFLELIHGNLSLNLYQRLSDCKELAFARETFIQNYMLGGGTAESAQKRLYIIIDLICSISYNAIALESPYTMDEIRKELYDSIDHILTAK